MKRVVSFLLTVILILSLIPAVSINAAGEVHSGKAGKDITWRLDVDSHVLYLNGTGPMYDYSTYQYYYEGLDFDYASSAPWFFDNYCIERVEISEGITHIGAYSFYRCFGLKEFSVPESVETIGDYAYYLCTGLSEITIPAHIKSLGRYSFGSCSSVREITVEDGVGDLGTYAFAPNSDYYWGSADDKMLLTKVNLGVVENYGKGAFSGQKSLREVNFAQGTRTIGESIFSGCSSLVDVELPNTVEEILSYAFSDTGISEIDLPDSVKSIGDYAFSSTGIYDLDIPESLKTIGAGAFSNSDIYLLTIPDTVTYIGDRAFANCGDLYDVTLGSGVTELPKNMFADCMLLHSVVITGGCTSIGENAFYNCKNLFDIALPASVAQIGDNAFAKCPELCRAYFGGTEDQWNMIDFGSGNSWLVRSTVNYGSAPHIHSWGKWSVTAEADCKTNSKGLMSASCSTCGKSVTRDFTLSHQFGDAVINVAPTCRSNGTAVKTCTKCGKTESVEINHTGVHTYGKWIEDDSEDDQHLHYKWRICTVCRYRQSVELGMAIHQYVENESKNVKPTCTEGGKNCFRCVYCHEEYFENVPALGHDLEHIDVEGHPEHWRCRRCGAAFADADGITPVSAIEHQLVHYPRVEPTLEKSGNIEYWKCSICNSMFADSEATTFIPAGEEILNVIKYESGDYTYILDNDGNATIILGEIDEWDGHKTIYIPSHFDGHKVVAISDGAFAYNNIPKLVIPQGVVSIGNGAFRGCLYMEKVVIPDSVVSIGANAFSECEELCVVEISGNSSLTAIGSEAFSGCASLESISIPASIRELGDGVFKNCSMFSDVYYDGSLADWNKIPVGEDNETLESCTMHFSARFIDVESDSWYAAASMWCADNGYMSGTSDNTFAPNMQLTRSMFVQILAKLYGADLNEYPYQASFTDVTDGVWYTNAVEWAKAEGVTGGTGDGRFEPNSPVTREQFATFMYAFARKCGNDLNASADLDGYTDASEISGWAKTAVEWAVAKELISGTSATTLSPKTVATRAQAAVIFKKYAEAFSE